MHFFGGLSGSWPGYGKAAQVNIHKNIHTTGSISGVSLLFSFCGICEEAKKCLYFLCFRKRRKS
jgi:hypothetical protein